MLFRSAGAQKAGRDPDALQVGAYINVGVGDDVQAAREAIKGSTATFAHFSASRGSDFEGQPDIMRTVTEKLVSSYDTKYHTQQQAPHVDHLDDEFVDWFAVTGKPDDVIQKLAPLVELGLRHMYFVGPWQDGLASKVMPALRGIAGHK